MENIKLSKDDAISGVRLRGMLLTVLRPATDCTNGGISSRVDKIVVITDDPSMQIFEPGPNAPAFIIQERVKGYKSLVPINGCPEGHVGFMAGGNYAVTSDSRWTFGALPIHDRSETKRMYDTLSR